MNRDGWPTDGGSALLAGRLGMPAVADRGRPGSTGNAASVLI